MKGAGGTNGGIGQFLIGLAMMIGGGYLLLNSISVTSTFGLGTRLYGFSAYGGGFPITSGMIMFPFMIGIGMIFYNAKSIVGWFLTGAALVALVFGVIASIRFTFHHMSAFDLITYWFLRSAVLDCF